MTKSAGSVPPFSGSGLSTRDLTRDQAIAALDVVENTLGAICGCELCKSGEGKPLPFETEMRELLLVEWADGTKEATRRALEVIKAGTGNLTKAEQRKLLKAVKKAIDDGFGKAVDGGLPKIFTAGYKKGKKDVVKRLSAEFVWEQIDKEATAWLHQHHMYWIGGYYDKQVSEFLSATVADGMAQGLGRDAIGNQLSEFFEKYPGVKAKPAAYWRGMAANGMNRSRNFGMLQGWDEVGVKELEILAMVDERTSDICFAPWTPIATIAGDKRIDQIVPGEKVLTGSGEYCTVKSSGSRISHSWVSIQLSSGCLLTVTLEHPILTVDGWKSAGQLQKGDQLALQESSNDNMRNVRQGVCQDRTDTGSEVLQCRMLSGGSEQKCLDDSDLRSLRQRIPSATLLCNRRASATLQPQVSGYGWSEGSGSCIACAQVQDVREGLQDKTDRVSFRENPEALLPGMSQAARPYDLRRLWQGVRVRLARIISPQILLSRLLSKITMGFTPRATCGRDIQRVQHRIQTGSRVKDLLYRLCTSTLQYRDRGRWGLLAYNSREAEKQSKQRAAHCSSWLQAHKADPGATERSTGEKRVEEYLRCSTGLSTVIDIQRLNHAVAIPAHNLEIEGDPTYVACDVVVHNCREMNGRIIPVSHGIGQRDMLMAAEDPEDVKTISPWLSLDKIEGESTKSIMDNGMIMPPYHFHCRTTVVEKL